MRSRPSARQVRAASTTSNVVRLQHFVAAATTLAETVARTNEIVEDTGEVLRVAANGRPVVWPSDDPGFVTLSELAARTNRHPDVLRRWCADGSIPAIRVGRTWAVSRETMAWLVAHNGRSRPRLDGHPRGDGHDRPDDHSGADGHTSGNGHASGAGQPPMVRKTRIP